jgi:hypothetical protein
MTTHQWADVERELFPEDDEREVSELEDDLRAKIRASKLAEIRRSVTSPSSRSWLRWG